MTRPREILTPAVLHVLLSLVDGVKHGYGIKLEVEERTNGALELGRELSTRPSTGCRKTDGSKKRAGRHAANITG